MNVLGFVLNYFVALSYIWIPESFKQYYVVGVMVFMLFVSLKNKRTNKYRDIHAWLIGFATAWATDWLYIDIVGHLSFTLLITLYGYVLYKEKKNEENEQIIEKGISENIVSGLFMPVSSFFVVLYATDDIHLAALIYCGWLCYGIYVNRLLFKKKRVAVAFTVISSLFMMYTFQFMPFGKTESIVCIICFWIITYISQKIIK